MKTIEFDIMDCSFISLGEWRFLSFRYAELSNIEYGYKINRKGQRIYFIKDRFLESLKSQGIL